MPAPTSPAQRRQSPAARALPTTRWALAGACLGLAGVLVSQAPAAWLAQALHQASDGRLLLAQARGTVWNGSAQMLLTGGAGSHDAMALPGHMHWQLRPHGWGGLQVQLRSDCCHREPTQLQLQPRWGGVTIALADGQSHWPAQLLGGLGTPWNTLQPEGELTLGTQGLQVQLNQGRLTLQGQLVLSASAMASRLSTLRPMGHYRLTLQGGPQPTLQLATLEGALRLSGSGQWVGGRLRFQGEASAAEGREAALANLLNIIGRRQGARSLISVG